MLRKNKSLAVVALGDPLAPRTWSRTPKNVCSEFSRRGVDVKPFNAMVFRGWSFVARCYYWTLFGSAPDVYAHACSMPFFQRIHGYNVASKLRKFHGQVALHFGGGGYSIDKSPIRLRHYLYIDSIQTTTKLYRRNTLGFNPHLEAMIATERQSFLSLTHIFAASEYLSRHLIADYGIAPERVTVVGSGLGLIEPYFGPKNYTNPTILFVAKQRFNDKGGETLMAAFEHLYRRPGMERVHLQVVGDPALLKRFAHLPRVTFHSFLKQEDLQRLFNAASLFAMPAANEPWGLVYLEAMACKLPIVGLRRNALPEITDNERFGFLVEDDCPVQVADALERALSDLDRLRQLGDDAQSFCLAHFTWERTVEKMLEQIYRDGGGI